MTHYEVLGLDRRATDVEVREAWRQRVRTHHPDRHNDAEAFMRSREAYEVLADPARRQAYDATLDAATVTVVAPAAISMDAEFERLTGKAPTDRQRRGLRLIGRVLDLAEHVTGARRGRK